MGTGRQQTIFTAAGRVDEMLQRKRIRNVRLGRPARVNLRWKLLGLGAIGLAIAVLVGAVSVGALGSANGTLHAVSGKQDAALAAAHEAQDAIASSQRDLMLAILAPAAATRDAKLKSLDDDEQQYAEDMKVIRHGLTSN